MVWLWALYLVAWAAEDWAVARVDVSETLGVTAVVATEDTDPVTADTEEGTADPAVMAGAEDVAIVSHVAARAIAVDVATGALAMDTSYKHLMKNHHICRCNKVVF